MQYKTLLVMITLTQSQATLAENAARYYIVGLHDLIKLTN